MRGLVITKKNQHGVYEAKRVMEEADNMGSECDLVYYEDFEMEFSSSWTFLVEGKMLELEKYNWCYARSGVKNRKVSFIKLKEIIFKELVEKGSTVLNWKSAIESPVLSKLEQQVLMVKAGLPVVEGKYVSWWNESVKADFPLVAKKLSGSMGRTVRLCQTMEDWNAFISEFGRENLLLQRDLGSREDYRVLVLGGKVLGAMKRSSTGGGFLTNVSAGGVGEKVEADGVLEELAQKVASVFSLDFAGVDMMRDLNKKLYVLEVNRFPQFGGFEKFTGMNVAKSIVEYMQRPK